MNQKIKAHSGQIDGWMVSTIVLIILVIAFGSLGIWAYLSYQEEKTGVDARVDAAVAEARRDQAEVEQKKFAEQEKDPRREFVGPDDYGRLTFSYPKTWSVYVAKDASAGGNFEAYLHPVTVHPVNSSSQYAIRVIISEKNYDDYLKQFESKIKQQKLRSANVEINGENGIRLDGNFSDKLRGAAVIFKQRDKTIVLQTDADTFKPDFETIIQTIKFNT